MIFGLTAKEQQILGLQEYTKPAGAICDWRAPGKSSGNDMRSLVSTGRPLPGFDRILSRGNQRPPLRHASSLPLLHGSYFEELKRGVLEGQLGTTECYAWHSDNTTNEFDSMQPTRDLTRPFLGSTISWNKHRGGKKIDVERPSTVPAAANNIFSVDPMHTHIQRPATVPSDQGSSKRVQTEERLFQSWGSSTSPSNLTGASNKHNVSRSKAAVHSTGSHMKRNRGARNLRAKRNQPNGQPSIWDDLVHAGSVLLWIGKEAANVVSLGRGWCRRHVGLSSTGELYDLSEGARCLGERVIDLRQLFFPDQTTQQFTIEVLPERGPTVVFACDSQDYLNDWQNALRAKQSENMEAQEKDRKVHRLQQSGPGVSFNPRTMYRRRPVSQRSIEEFAREDLLENDRRRTLANWSATNDVFQHEEPQDADQDGPDNIPQISVNFATVAQGGQATTVLSQSQSAEAGANHLPTSSMMGRRKKWVEPKKFEATESMQQKKIKALETKTETGIMEMHRVARVHAMNPHELEAAWSEFQFLTQGENEIPREKFGERLAESLGVPQTKLPAQFRRQHSQHSGNTPQKPILFEEFMVWYKAHEFDPLLAGMVDTEDEKVANLCEQYDMAMTDFENLQKTFNRYEEDGQIGREAFNAMVVELLHCNEGDLPAGRLQHFFQEATCQSKTGKTDTIGFHEFVEWYQASLYSKDHKEKAAGGSTQLYASLGTLRFKPLPERHDMPSESISLSARKFEVSNPEDGPASPKSKAPFKPPKGATTLKPPGS